MWTSLLFAASLAAQPSLIDVDLGWDGTTLGVTAIASAPLSREDARASFTGRALRIHLSGTALGAAERTFGRESRALIVARRVQDGIVLEVPIGNRLDCKGPVEIAAVGNILAASLGCTLKGSGPVPASEKVAPRAERPSKIEKPATLEQLRSAVQLTPEPLIDHSRAKGDQAPPAAAPTTALPADPPHPEGNAASGAAPLGALGALAALGTVGLLLARRRGHKTRIVNIVETAQLGPKRSLVVARVGNETLLLGASEAGISLLSTVRADEALQAAGDALAAGLSPAALEAELDRLEPVTSELPAEAPAVADADADASQTGAVERDAGQASLLRRLLGHKSRSPEASFEALLAESAEDRDLRQKLEAGFAGEGVVSAAGALTAVAEPGLSLSVAGGGSSAVKVFLLLTALSFASAIFVSVTSFTRIVIVLSFLRQALGTPSLPPNQVLTGLSLALTCFVMADPAQRIYRDALSPYLEDRIGHAEALDRGVTPLREFMLRQTREKDLQLFFEISRSPAPSRADPIPMTVAVPAFMISELTTAFRMGLFVYIPLLLVDLFVSAILMSLGMMMVPPSLVSLPLKLGIFLMADGWHLVVASLARSF